MNRRACIDVMSDEDWIEYYLPPASPVATQRTAASSPRRLHFLSKHSDPIGNMIFVNLIRAEAGLPPLGLDDL